MNRAMKKNRTHTGIIITCLIVPSRSIKYHHGELHMTIENKL